VCLRIGIRFATLVSLFTIGPDRPPGFNFLVFVGCVLEVFVALGLAQGIWAVLEIVSNTREVLPPAADVFE